MSSEVEIQLSAKDYESGISPTWCPGCGDFAVLKATQRALAELKIPYHQVMAISGIGCSSNFPHFLKGYGVHSLHGRTLAVAQGAQLANHNLTVIAAGGDGDGYGIGAGHWLHACRRNINVKYFAMDNQIYGLTTGQTSPTSLMDMITKSTPGGNIESPISPIVVSLGAGATFVARGFSGNIKQLTELFKAALKHKGFAMVDVLSPCVTFNKINTYPWFKKRVYQLEDSEHDSSDFSLAMNKALEWPTLNSEEIPTGIFYQTQKPAYEDLEPVLQDEVLVDQKLGFTQKEGLKFFDPYY